MADVLEELGGVPLDRILFHPPPGTARLQDVIEMEARENRLCELVDGVLVQKPMGFKESILAVAIAASLREFVVPRNLGHVSGTDGMLQLFPGLIRMPDVAFMAWERFPNGRLPNEPAPSLAPDLAVEVLSRSNTAGEMQRKLREYFSAGVKLVWLVDLEARKVTVYRDLNETVELGDQDSLDGGSVLPGLTLSIGKLFAELDRRA
jgi:Uma2 family endonuclease